MPVDGENGWNHRSVTVSEMEKGCLEGGISLWEYPKKYCAWLRTPAPGRVTIGISYKTL